MALYLNTLSQVRQYLAEAVGDLIVGTADSGSVNTIVHTMLRQTNDYYNDHRYRAYIYNGTAMGQEREISDWVLANSQLVVSPVFANAITNTSKYELHHIFFADEYLKAINLAIESLAGKYLVDLQDESSITLTADTYEYSLPTSFLYLYQVTEEDTVGSDIYYESGIIDPRDWTILRAYPAKLKLDDTRVSVTAGKHLRLEGQGTQPIVDDDDDIIYFPTDWLVQKAITFLPQSKVQSNKLDNTYRQALVLSAREPRSYPNERAVKIVE